MSAKIDFSKISFLVVDGDKISAQVVFDTLSYLGATAVQRVRSPNDAFEVLRIDSDSGITDGENGVRTLFSKLQ